MGQFLLLVVVALTVGAVVFGVTVLLTGGDSGLSPAEPDGRAVPLPGTRPLAESDVAHVRFDVTARGYRMAQVDQAMRRAAYDIGYKDELINVLEAEVDALRSGRFSDAEVLRRAREAAQAASSGGETPAPADGQEVATVSTAELGPAETEQPAGPQDQEPAGPQDRDPAASREGEPAASQDREPAASREGEPGTVDSEELAEPVVEATDQPAAQTGTGKETDRPEPDSIMPSRR